VLTNLVCKVFKLLSGLPLEHEQVNIITCLMIVELVENKQVLTG